MEELLRGTEVEIEEAMDDRSRRGIDGDFAQELTTGEWVLMGTPEDEMETNDEGG